ncbi:MAG: hypothetical protein RMK00_09195 [Bacteroidota bacterium]|nr:hypothetical protein [Bacteroidota bacterium]
MELKLTTEPTIGWRIPFLIGSSRWLGFVGGNYAGCSEVVSERPYQSARGSDAILKTAIPQVHTQPYFVQGTYSWAMGGNFFGSSAQDSIAMVTIVGDEIYFCGWTTSSSFPGANGNPGGGRDILVGKIKSDGTLRWATILGGNSDDVAYGLAVNATMVVVVGETRSLNFPVGNTAFQRQFGGGSSDGVIVTLDAATGTRLSATYLGGNQADALAAVTLTRTGIVVAGTTESANLPATTHQQSKNGSTDGYIALCRSDLGGIVWSTYYGGMGTEKVSALAASENTIYIAGTTASYATSSEISGDDAIEGIEPVRLPDGFVAAFSYQGQRRWGRYLGTRGRDTITTLAVGPSEQVVIVGFTDGPPSPDNQIVSAPVAQERYNGNTDGFCVVLNSNGMRRWGSYYGGSGADRCTGAAMDAQGYVLVTGWTTSTDLELRHSDNSAIAGAEDIMVGFFSPDGTRRIASLLYGGSGSDLPVGISFLPDSSIAVVGTTTSTSFPPLSGNNAGAMDGFFLRLQSLGILSASPSVSSALPAITTAGSQLRIISPQECIGATVHVYLLHGVLVAHHTLDHEETVFCLPPGVYAVTLQCPSGAVLRQLVLLR